MKSTRVPVIFAIVFAMATALLACEWDYDTLKMERMRFPDALELVTGKFLRHSEEFYQWRIDDRLKRLEEDPKNLALYDDLAVAYDKTGQQEKAIETILKKEEIDPGRYETYANLGTFHIHAGRLEEGLEYIKKAIEINPDAHFGREVYQQYLVEYLLSKRDESGKFALPLDEGERFNSYGFAKFVLEKPAPGESESGATDSTSPPSSDEQMAQKIQPAMKGVLGMMRFGNYDSPILLEALGDLLMSHPNTDGKRLAARAYLKASYEVDDEEAKGLYREKAEQVVSLQTREPNRSQALGLNELEIEFKRELAEARKWWEELRANELRWIASEDTNPDEMFTKTYYREPSLGKDASASAETRVGTKPWMWWVVALLLAMVAAAIVASRAGSSPAKAK